MIAIIVRFVIDVYRTVKEKAMKHLGALCESPRDYWPEKEGRIKVLARIVIPAVLMTLAILINPAAACAQNDRGCAWPLEMSPEGTANFQLPDDSARYWIMPFDTQYETMTIKGTYPNIRYFSFVAYETIKTGFNIAGHLYDAHPDRPRSGQHQPVRPTGRS